MKRKLIDLREFSSDGGFCWIAGLPQDIELGESESGTRKSGLRLFEDGIELGPPSAAHESIRRSGAGSFSHWSGQLYFSSSDNTDPRRNKRKYVALVEYGPSQKSVRDRPAGNAVRSAVNHSAASFDPSRIEADCEYALNVARSYVGSLGGAHSMAGKSVLELGPGPNFASVLILRCLGARAVAVADRFLAGFDENYHPKLYREVARRLTREYPGCDTSPLLNVADSGHVQPLIDAREVPLEHLADCFRDIDITLSNAVLEHLFNPMEGARALYDISADGAIGLHQVDFRDHRSFDRPLEYLLMDEMSFLHLFNSCHGECGGRTRPFQMKAMFLSAGFKGVEFSGNMKADEDYLADVISRMNRLESCLYRGVDARELSVISGRFHLLK